MIFPEIKDSSWFNRAKEGFSGLFGSGPDHQRFYVPDPFKMREQCLKIYLEPYKQGLFNGVFEANFDIQQAVMQFSDLYKNCVHQYCGTTERVSDWDISLLPVRTT